MGESQPAAEIAERLARQGGDARTRGDWAAMIAAGDGLERIGAYAAAWPLLADAPLLRTPAILPEWRGETGVRLLVRRRIRHAGAELRMARLLAAAADVAEVAVATERRLQPLLARSFPSVRVLAMEDMPDPGIIADVATSYEGLAQHFGRTPAEIAAGFVPLAAEPARIARFRRAHRPGEAPVTGIAWHSTNGRKSLPSRDDWSALLAREGGRWASLQYGEAAAGVDDLATRSGMAITRAGGFDQMADLDGFAAQVTAVDGVLTISNTTAHMAGALGIPCVVLLDDQDHLSWPASGDGTPFYPHLRLVRRQRRHWRDVLDDAYNLLLTLSFPHPRPAGDAASGTPAA